MSISAMKCALQSLESVEKVKGWNKDSVIGRHCSQSAHFLRQAIEQAEKQDPVAFRNINTGEFCTGGFLRKDWAKWQPLYAAPVHAVDMSQERVDETDKDRHEWAMQKMVDENQRLGLYDDEQPTCQENRQVAKSATTEWVGLTDEEKEAATGWSVEHIEAKLKEKNSL
jgi:hypothetical protein